MQYGHALCQLRRSVPGPIPAIAGASVIADARSVASRETAAMLWILRSRRLGALATRATTPCPDLEFPGPCRLGRALPAVC